MSLLHQASCVAIGNRALLIEGEPGSGKSSLALALIDRGAVLVGDDGVLLERQGNRLLASPPESIAGLLEVRNIGLVRHATARRVALALAVRLDREAPRFIEAAQNRTLAGVAVPLVLLWPDSPVLALRAEAALHRWGLAETPPSLSAGD